MQAVLQVAPAERFLRPHRIEPRAVCESTHSRDEFVIPLTGTLDPAKPVWRGIVPLFATTLFVSSLLMFALEPIVAKTVLPILGGTPMVWNTCVLFFQILLLGGYGYAHGVTRWLGSRPAGAAYLVLLLLPFATLPFAIGAEAQPPADGNPIGWLLLVLAKSIGLPFFALAASAPILQRWFADTDHGSANDPYFLYAASNLGSLLALVMYPVVIEPLLPLRMQNHLWEIGYGVFVVAACLSMAVGWRHKARVAVAFERSAEPRDATAASPTWKRRATWIGLAFIPSSLMLAVTTYFSTDIAPVPLFWIAPLALYLVTFVVAFSSMSASSQSIADRFMPLLVLPLVVLVIAGSGLYLSLAIPLHLAAFTMAALVCHGRLAADRPAPVHLTEFYFWIAFGGMLGGVFNTLAAPLLFSRIIEYPLVLVLALAARQGRRQEAGSVWSLNDLFVPIGVGALSAGFMVWLHPGRDSAQLFVAGLGAPALVAFTQSRAPRRFAASVATMLVAGLLAANAQGQTLLLSRTFFGVYRVTADQGARYHSLYHGTTLHGMQAVDPAHQGEALTYYHREGPIGQAFAGLPGVAARRNIAVVGLGVGTLASYRAPGQQWTFYEIDPEVERIARTEKYFTFLKSCGDSCRVVLGDARLSLARAPEREYGFMVLDAFSSDAIPVHLMTAEAIGLYLSRLAPGGVLAFHISNRHLSLAPVLARVALSHRLVVRLQQHSAGQTVTGGPLSSGWMVMARTESDLGSLAGDTRWIVPSVPASTPLWTDDFSNILSVMNLNPR
jgi:spermidine synthase